MIRFIAGEHRISEPLAFDVGQSLVKLGHIVYEYPDYEHSDYVPAFDRYCDELRNKRCKPAEVFHDIWKYVDVRGCLDWCSAIAQEYPEKLILGLHDRFDSGKMDAFPLDKDTRSPDRNDSTEVPIELHLPLNTTHELPMLLGDIARKHSLRLYTTSVVLNYGYLEIVLPSDMDKIHGISEENVPELDRLIKLALQPSSRHITLDSLLGLDHLRDLNFRSPFLIAQKSDPRYGLTVGQIAGFLDEASDALDDITPYRS